MLGNDYTPPNPPKFSEVQDGKLMTVIEFGQLECNIRRLSGRYFGVFEVDGTVFMTEGHEAQEDAKDSAEGVADLISPLDAHETL